MQSAVQTAQKWIIASPKSTHCGESEYFVLVFFRNILIFCKSEFDTLEEVCKVIITCYGSLNKTACLIFYKNVGDNHVNLTGQTGHSKSNLLNLAHHPITQRSN